jgi:hypothetical protein
LNQEDNSATLFTATADLYGMATTDGKAGSVGDVEHVERGDDNLKDNEPIVGSEVNQDNPEIYIEALARYPNDESIDRDVEKRLIRKIDMRILPLLGICYFFYYVDKTTLSVYSMLD